MVSTSPPRSRPIRPSQLRQTDFFMIDHRVSAGQIDFDFPLLSSSPPAPDGRGKTASTVGADKERPS
jgi:hypothetical protein